MMDLNRVSLIGRLGRDPEIRSMQSGARVCNLSVATSERWKSKSGEQQEKTEWTRVIVFDENLVDIAEKYLASGSRLFVEGQLQTRKWTDQSGNERYATEVVLNKFRGQLIVLDSKEQRQGSSSAPPPGDLDSDIPF